MKTTKKARIERNPIIYRHDKPPKILPPRWNIWSEEKTSGAGNLVGVALTLRGAKWMAAAMGYDGRVWLRSGDKGREKWKPIIRWFYHRLLQSTGLSFAWVPSTGPRAANSAQERSSRKLPE